MFVGQEKKQYLCTAISENPMHSKAWPVVIKASRRPMDVIAQQLINLKSCI